MTALAAPTAPAVLAQAPKGISGGSWGDTCELLVNFEVSCSEASWPGSVA